MEQDDAWIDEIVQAASDLHDQIIEAYFEITKNIFNNSTTFDARDDMLDNNARAGDNPVQEFDGLT